MKKLFRLIAALLFALIVVAGIICKPVIKSGYLMYKEAVESMPVQAKVEEICQSDTYTKFEDISPEFIDELIRAEDRRFYKHIAVDPISLARAVVVNVNRRKYTQGGSTITQQLAKNMYFTFDKDLSRKVAEVFVALELEKQYSKDDILAMYCAVVYFGQNCYGVKQASEYYYDTVPAQLDEEQSKELVNALKAPSISNPSTK